MTARRFSPYLFVLPAFVVLGLIVIYPMIYNVINSTFSTPEYERAAEFIGFKNYEVLLKDPRFYDALRLTLIWTVGCTSLQYIVGLAAALLLNGRLSILRWVRPFYILPWIIPGVTAAMAFRFMYANDVGLINTTLRSLGLGDLARPWIATPDTAMGAAIVLGVWKGFPYYMIMLLAGLQNIPVELIEAARIDGANYWQVLRRITLPLLAPISSISILLGIIWTSNYFDGIFLLTGGGPARATFTLPIYIYNVGFSVFDLPKASAASVLLLILVTVLASVYLFISQASVRRNA
ncbi:MAG: sugar ABC transporter permease [Anaerolineae bacterium]|nr:sugar ABC transporter permease [Anaerolineae bacterium]